MFDRKYISIGALIIIGLGLGWGAIRQTTIFRHPSTEEKQSGKAQMERTESERDTEVPRETKAFLPVTGAFGWKLGEALRSDRYKLERLNDGRYSVSYNSDEDGTIAPFKHVYVLATKEGLIYQISAWCDPGEEDYTTFHNSILQTLSEKYQPNAEYGHGKTYHYFGDENALVELEAKVASIEVSYRHMRLWKSLVSELETMKEQELRRKEQGIRDSLKGL